MFVRCFVRPAPGQPIVALSLNLHSAPHSDDHTLLRNGHADMHRVLALLLSDDVASGATFSYRAVSNDGSIDFVGHGGPQPALQVVPNSVGNPNHSNYIIIDIDPATGAPALGRYASDCGSVLNVPTDLATSKNNNHNDDQCFHNDDQCLPVTLLLANAETYDEWQIHSCMDLLTAEAIKASLVSTGRIHPMHPLRLDQYWCIEFLKAAPPPTWDVLVSSYGFEGAVVRREVELAQALCKLGPTTRHLAPAAVRGEFPCDLAQVAAAVAAGAYGAAFVRWLCTPPAFYVHRGLALGAPVPNDVDTALQAALWDAPHRLAVVGPDDPHADGTLRDVTLPAGSRFRVRYLWSDADVDALEALTRSDDGASGLAVLNMSNCSGGLLAVSFALGV